MNKTELIKAFAKEAQISEEMASSIVQIFFDSIKEGLISGDGAEIRGFGSFSVKKYDSYTGRNPKTGEPIEVPPKVLPHFKVGKELKERIKGLCRT